MIALLRHPFAQVLITAALAIAALFATLFGLFPVLGLLFQTKDWALGLILLVLVPVMTSLGVAIVVLRFSPLFAFTGLILAIFGLVSFLQMRGS